MRAIRTAAVLVAAGALTANCSSPDRAVQEPAESTSVPSPTSSSPRDRDGDGTPDSTDEYPDDPSNTPVVEVTLNCFLDDTFSTQQVFSIRGEPDFTAVWAQTPYSCEAARNGSVPMSPLEQQALDASGYANPASITTLYQICAEVDPTDVYTAGDHSATPEQIAEITGVLTLCPDHPLAADLRATIERGQVDAKLGTAGRLFGPGTYLVGEEIEPGTYFIEGKIEGCYWERQDSAGEIIDNNFVGAGRRVEVTIRSSDYAFHSDGCGQWRPVG